MLVHGVFCLPFSQLPRNVTSNVAKTLDYATGRASQSGTVAVPAVDEEAGGGYEDHFGYLPIQGQHFLRAQRPVLNFIRRALRPRPLGFVGEWSSGHGRLSLSLSLRDEEKPSYGVLSGPYSRIGGWLAMNQLSPTELEIEILPGENSVLL